MSYAAERTPVSPSGGMPAARFLIVDDSRAIQAIIRRAIEAGGYPAADIRTAPDGAAALDLMEQFQPDLVISDWHMPRVSGLEMLQAMRQMGASDIKVGFVTTESSPRLLDEARTNGALFIVNKPFKDDDLVAQIRAAVPLDGRAPQPPEPVRAAMAERAAAAPVAATAASPAADDEDDGLPLPLAHARGLVEHTLGDAGFELKLAPPLGVGELGAVNLLGLYSAPGKPVAAVGVLDAASICLLGGGAARLPAARIHAALLARQPSDDMVTQATTFLRAVGMMLRTPAGAEACNLARTMTVPAGFAKLQEVLSRSGGRSDFVIERADIGVGRFSFLVL